jgi:DNA-binding transcriptional regulator YiaG
MMATIAAILFQVVCQSGNKTLDDHVADLVTMRTMENPLKICRERLNLSKADFAKLLEVSRSIAHRWETGERKIGPDSLARISQKTGIAPRELRPDLAEKLGGNV